MKDQSPPSQEEMTRNDTKVTCCAILVYDPFPPCMCCGIMCNGGFPCCYIECYDGCWNPVWDCTKECTNKMATFSEWCCGFNIFC